MVSLMIMLPVVANGSDQSDPAGETCGTDSQGFPWEHTFTREGLTTPEGRDGFTQDVSDFVIDVPRYGAEAVDKALNGDPGLPEEQLDWPETYRIERLPTQRLCEVTAPFWVGIRARNSTLVGGQWHVAYTIRAPECWLDDEGYPECPHPYGWTSGSISWQDPLDLRNDLLYGSDAEGCTPGDWMLDVEFGATPDTFGQISLHAFPIREDEASFYFPGHRPCSN